MAEGGDQPDAIRALEGRRRARIIMQRLRHDIHSRLRPNYGVAATVNLYFEENLCYRLSHQVMEDTGENNTDRSSELILVADRRQIVHEHARNLDHFMLCHERDLLRSQYWEDNQYNYLYVAMGEISTPGWLRVPDIKFCRDPRASRLEYQEIPTMVSTRIIHAYLHVWNDILESIVMVIYFP